LISQYLVSLITSCYSKTPVVSLSGQYRLVKGTDSSVISQSNLTAMD